MLRNLEDLVECGKFSDPAKRVNVYQVCDADGTVVATLTYDEIMSAPRWSRLCYQFSLLWETGRSVLRLKMRRLFTARVKSMRKQFGHRWSGPNWLYEAQNDFYRLAPKKRRYARRSRCPSTPHSEPIYST